MGHPDVRSNAAWLKAAEQELDSLEEKYRLSPTQQTAKALAQQVQRVVIYRTLMGRLMVCVGPVSSCGRLPNRDTSE
jgi:hypothetical protein